MFAATRGHGRRVCRTLTMDLRALLDEVSWHLLNASFSASMSLARAPSPETAGLGVLEPWGLDLGAMNGPRGVWQGVGVCVRGANVRTQTVFKYDLRCTHTKVKKCELKIQYCDTRSEVLSAGGLKANYCASGRRGKGRGRT